MTKLREQIVDALRSSSKKEPSTPVRKITKLKRDKDGLFVQPDDNSAEREVIENHHRQGFANHFHFADMYTGNTRTYDPEGRYNCGRCNMADGTGCLLVNIKKIGLDAGSCGDWENTCAGDPELLLEEKSIDAAGYGEAENGIGFGCHRCPYASPAKACDSRGRELYCGKGDFRTFGTACCAINGAELKKVKLEPAHVDKDEE